MQQRLIVKIMEKKFFLIKTFIIYFFLLSNGFTAQTNYFKEGRALFESKEFVKSKIFFEKDIVFNPRSEKSYLYLAKIFNYNENEQSEELNLNSVLILNPKNDEALYMLILLKIKQYDYDQAKQLIKKFDLVCKSFCSKKAEIKDKFSKLTPDNEKDNN